MTTSARPINLAPSSQSHGRGFWGLKEEGTVGKTAVLGMVERQGNVVTAIVGEESQNAVLPNVREKVLPSSLIYSDEHAAYNPLRSMMPSDTR